MFFICMDLGGLGSRQGHRIIEVTSAWPQSSFLVKHDFLTQYRCDDNKIFKQQTGKTRIEQGIPRVTSVGLIGPVPCPSATSQSIASPSTSISIGWCQHPDHFSLGFTNFKLFKKFGSTEMFICPISFYVSGFSVVFTYLISHCLPDRQGEGRR